MSCNSAQVRLVGADLPLESNAGALLFGDCPLTKKRPGTFPLPCPDHSEHAGCIFWFVKCEVAGLESFTDQPRNKCDHMLKGRVVHTGTCQKTKR